MSQLLRLVENGESVVIARAGKPVAEMKWVDPKEKKQRKKPKKRAFGGWEMYKKSFDELERVELGDARKEFFDEDIANP